VLIEVISLEFNPVIMGATGDLAMGVIDRMMVEEKDKYIFVVEGSIPMEADGFYCTVCEKEVNPVTALEWVKNIAANSMAVVAVGSCASWGGIPSAPPNPTGAVPVTKIVKDKPIINIPGCPPHPDWIVWTVSQILLNKKMKLDKSGRPVTLFSKTVHSLCPRRGTEEASTFGIPGRCLEELGCRGPETHANCPTVKWNGGVSWCIATNSPCIGCTEPSFPGAASFYSEGEGDD
jgi:hydrogenase small subunit